MCLGLPGRIVAVDDADVLRQGTVDFGGVTRDVCLAYVPDAGVGDWVLVHVGFAISRLNEDEAAQTIAALRELAAAVANAEAPEQGDGQP